MPLVGEEEDNVFQTLAEECNITVIAGTHLLCGMKEVYDNLAAGESMIQRSIRYAFVKVLVEPSNDIALRVRRYSLSLLLFCNANFHGFHENYTLIILLDFHGFHENYTLILLPDFHGIHENYTLISPDFHGFHENYTLIIYCLSFMDSMKTTP